MKDENTANALINNRGDAKRRHITCLISIIKNLEYNFLQLDIKKKATLCVARLGQIGDEGDAKRHSVSYTMYVFK